MFKKFHIWIIRIQIIKIHIFPIHILPISNRIAVITAFKNKPAVYFIAFFILCLFNVIEYLPGCTCSIFRIVLQ